MKRRDNMMMSVGMTMIIVLIMVATTVGSATPTTPHHMHTTAHMHMVNSTMNHNHMDHTSHAVMNHSDHTQHDGMDHTGHTHHGGMDHSDNTDGGMDHSNHIEGDGTGHSNHTGGDGMGHSNPIECDGMDHSNHDNHLGSSHVMQMFFHTGVSEYILFERLLTMNAGDMVGACIFMFFLSIVYEGLKFFREYLLRHASLNHRNTYAPSLGADVATKQPEVGSKMLSGSHAVQTILHMVQVFISYCLMLVFMTYNVYLCIAVILGAGAGYFLFGWRRAMVVDINEHCH